MYLYSNFFALSLLWLSLNNVIIIFFRYLVGCDNILAKLHTKHPELCDKVGGLLAMHIDDLRVFAPMWLSKTEEVREDRDHWATNITGDIYGKGWISEMYGYSFGAAEVSFIFPLTFSKRQYEQFLLCHLVYWLIEIFPLLSRFMFFLCDFFA